MQVYSDDDGETWHTDKIISGMVKREESRYYLTGPGHGIQIQNGDHAGRLVVPIYYQLTGGMVRWQVAHERKLFIVMMVETLGHTVTAFLEQSVMNLLL